MPVVIDCDFFVLLDEFAAENPDSMFPVHDPFLGLGIRVAAVIDESCFVSFHSRVDDVRRIQLHEVAVMHS